MGRRCVCAVFAAGETLLAEALPAALETDLLDFRATHGATLAEMTRYTDHLDDMPAVGYGFSSLLHADDGSGANHQRFQASSTPSVVRHHCCPAYPARPWNVSLLGKQGRPCNQGLQDALLFGANFGNAVPPEGSLGICVSSSRCKFEHVLLMPDVLCHLIVRHLFSYCGPDTRPTISREEHSQPRSK